jgi:eukaryotic-like serine/threonine-protein kinase
MRESEPVEFCTFLVVFYLLLRLPELIGQRRIDAAVSRSDLRDRACRILSADMELEHNGGEGMKEVCPECGAELDDHHAASGCRESSSSRSEAAEENEIHPGDRLSDSYQIESLVGRGSVGCIYKARDVLRDRVVAVKILHRHLMLDRLNIQRFQQEARAVSAVSHPNVITAYDFGLLENMQPYLITDFVQGMTLAAIVEMVKGLEAMRAAHILVQCCDAMHFAHTRGVIHRNLKPAKIMVRQYRDDPDFVTIVGFGFAKLLPLSGKPAEDLLPAGEIFGTPVYMAPEQFLGKDADPRTDIYALGCVMYETLSGKPPFFADNVLELMHKHIHEVPPPFSALRPDLTVPANLENICRRALEKEPKSRFQKMAEMRDAIMIASNGAGYALSFAAQLQSLRSQIKLFMSKWF